jgi:hypothetical protein
MGDKFPRQAFMINNGDLNIGNDGVPRMNLERKGRSGESHGITGVAHWVLDSLAE